MKTVVTPDMKHIQRIDHKGTAGYQVKIKRKHFYKSKYFGDATYGTGSLDAAIAYRDELLARIKNGTAKSSRKKKRATVQYARRRGMGTTRTGVRGVSLTYRNGDPELVIAVGTPPNKKTASVSVKKWGIRKSCWRAVARLVRFRREMNHSVPAPDHLYNDLYTNVVALVPDGTPA